MRHTPFGSAARRAIGAAVVLAAAAGPAAACPMCDTGTGEAVRDGIAEELPLNLAATVLPFATVGLVVAAVHLGLPGRWREDRP